MDVGDERLQHVGKTGRQTHRGEAKGARHAAGNAINRDPAGKLAGLGAAHAVAHGEEKVGRGERGIAGFTEITQFVAVKREGEEGVFVVFPDFARMRETGPNKTIGRGGHGGSRRTTCAGFRS